MSIKTVGIIGAGTMGNGIAQAFTAKGFDVIMQDIADTALQKGLATITGSLDRQIKKGTLTEDAKQAALKHICTTTHVSDLAKADIVIEAATENESVKIKILQGVEAVLRPETIIATNTSSLSITKLAAATKRPAQMVGMHFFQSCADDGPGGDYSWPSDIGQHRAGGHRSGQSPGQDPHRCEKQCRVCGEPNSVPDD